MFHGIRDKQFCLLGGLKKAQEESILVSLMRPHLAILRALYPMHSEDGKVFARRDSALRYPGSPCSSHSSMHEPLQANGEAPLYQARADGRERVRWKHAGGHDSRE